MKSAAGSSASNGTSPSLLVRVRENDGEAWTQLVDVYAPLVANWCERRGLNPEDTADVMQDVFLAVSRGLEGYSPNPGRDGSFRAWLWTITRHRIVDWYRSGRRHLASGGSSNQRQINGIVEPSLDDAEPTTPLDRHLLVRRAMNQVESMVASGTWRAFWRTVIDGQRTDCVADELGLSAAAVRQARSRVLRRLREQLGDR